MADTVTLRNPTRLLQVFNLPREHVPEAAQRARVARASHDVTTVHGKNDAPASPMAGARSVSVRTEILSGSVTFLAGETKALPRSVLLAPEVKRAFAAFPARLVVVEKQAPAAMPGKAPSKRGRKVGGDGE